MYKDLNRQYVIYPEHERYYKAFVSVMRRYRKEYRKYFLRKCIIPQARRKVTRGILYEDTSLPKEIINNIVSYM